MNLVSHRDGHSGRRRLDPPTCPYCFSGDTMEPFRKPAHVFLLSRILPRLRRRYCRTCTRHFLIFLARSTVAAAEPGFDESVPLALDSMDTQR